MNLESYNVQLIIKMLLIVGIGTGIGWITNYIAIKMLFRPYKEINFVFFKIQGLIPKRKHQIGEKLAEAIQQEIFSLKDIIKSLDVDMLEKKISEVLDKILEERLANEISTKFPMLAMFMSDDTLEKIKKAIKDAVLENKNEIVSMIAQYLEDSVDLKKIIVVNVDGFSLEKLEQLTYTLASKELKHIEIVGAVLGGIIGIIQFGISFVI